MRQNSQKTQTVVVCALLVALQIIFSRFFSITTPVVKIGFDFLPMAMAGMLFGPFWGGAVGIMADFLGSQLFPIGAYFPGFTLTAGLCGMTYGLFLRGGDMGCKTQMRWWFRLVIAVVIVCIPLQLGLNTVWLSVILGKGYWALLPGRVLKAVLIIPVQFMTIQGVLGIVRRTNGMRIATSNR